MKKTIIYSILIFLIPSTSFGGNLYLVCTTSGNRSQTIVVDLDKKIINGVNGKWNKGEITDDEIKWYQQSSDFGTTSHRLNRFTGILTVEFIDGPLVGKPVHPWKCSPEQHRKF